MIYGELRFANSVGLHHVGYNHGSLSSISCRRSYGDWINRGPHHLGRAFDRPGCTPRNEPSRSGERHQGFDYSQCGLLGNGRDFSNFGIRNCVVPASTDRVAKWRDEWPF